MWPWPAASHAAGPHALRDPSGAWGPRFFLPYFLRAPVRPSLVSTAAAGLGPRVLYVPVWKSASSSILTAMARWPFHAIAGAHDWLSAGCLPLRFGGPGRPCKHTSATARNVSRAFTFTVVRDPLRRFLAGVREHGAWGRNLSRNLRDVRAKARGMLRAYPRGLASSAQVGAWGSNADQTQSYLLSGTDADGRPLRFDFIGRYEQLSASWRELGLRLGMPWVPPLVVNNTSGPRRFKDKLLAAVLDDVEILCCVCWIYLQDYACFGYDLPPPCCSGRGASCTDFGIRLEPELLRVLGC